MAKIKQETSGQRPNHIMLGRTLVLMIVCGIVAFVVLGVKLYDIQINNHEYYEQLAVEQQTRETTVSASRGTIYDANGNALAISATAYTVYLSPYEVQDNNEDINMIADRLSVILGVDREMIIEKSQNTDSWYETIASKIEPEVADQVRAFINEHELRGVHIENDTKRFYPYGSLACHVVGFTGTDGYGLEGAEANYNSYLEGEEGSIVRLATADGTEMMYTNYENYYDAENGDDLTLTLDVTAQYIAEKYLEQAIEDYDVQHGGCCIVMNVNTGEILALASMDNYDLNDYLTVGEDVQEELALITDETERDNALYEAQMEQWRNMALSDTYEPGSVFKIITLAMALEENASVINQTYDCGGSVNVLGRTDPVDCWNDAGHGPQTLTQAAQHSCNVAFVNIGLSVGAEKFYEYCEAFGFFDETGIDLAGEASSQWWSEEVFFDELNYSQLAAASFGQTFNITPIQMITAVSAVANGGYLMEPYVVSRVQDFEGNTVYSQEPTVVRQVISEETSETVCDILEAVVGDEEGTGRNAYVPGYRVAGKTGTSEKVAQDAIREEGDEKEYMVSFCGFAPADDPEIAVLVILDTPSSETGMYISGGNMAAPVVGNILSEVLPYYGVEPVYTEEEESIIDVTVPYLLDMAVDSAVSELEMLGVSVQIVGEGPTVTGQLPAAGAEVAAGTEIILYAGGVAPTDMVTMPDLYGMTVEEARYALAELGLFMNTSGAAATSADIVVSRQSVAVEQKVQYGTVIEVTLVDNSNLGRY